MTVSVAGGEFVATDPFDVVPGSVDAPRTVGLADGSLLVAWASGPDLSAWLFDRQGSKVGSVITIANVGNPGQVALLARPEGGFVVAWAGLHFTGPDDSGFSVWARTYDGNGQPTGEAFPVNTTTFASQQQPTIAPLAGGGFMIAWHDQYGDSADSTHGQGLKGQLFNASGAKVGGEFAVNTDPYLSQYNPRAFALAGGDILITWAMSHDGIHAQLFDSAGAKKGLEFKLGNGLQTAVGLASGGFLVVDGSSGELVGQIHAADAAKIGGPFTINTTTAGDQFLAEATLLPSGDVMVSWYDSGGGSAHSGVGDIKAQLLDSNGNKIGDEFTVNVATEGGQWQPQIAAFGSGDVAVFWLDYEAPYPTPELQGRLLYSAESGTGGNDLLAGTADRDFLYGLGGNDVLYFGTALSAGDVADGGDGRDAIVLQGNVVAVLSSTNLAGIESISIQSGANATFGDTANNFYDYDVTTADGNVAAGQQLIVNAQSLRAGEDFTFDGSAESDGKFVVYGGHGVDDLTGGAGVDVFFFEGQRWTAGDRVDGGAGRDALVISGGSGLTHIEFEADSFVNIESVSVNNRFATDPSQKPSYELVLDNGNVAAGGTLIVNGSSIPLGQVVNIDGRGVHDGNLTLLGGGGHDVILAGDGADLIIGGGGADSLAGGAGADTFRYDAASDSAVGLSDLIADFQTGVDRIDLSRIDADTTAAGDQAFTWIGAGAFSGAAGELRVRDDGAYRWVEGDTNGDGNADFAIAFYQSSAPQVQGDFLL